jgi:hypothetical protein
MALILFILLCKQVSQAMSSNYLSVGLSSTIQEAVQCMDNGHQTCVLVIDTEEHLEGILTYGDIKRGMLRECDEIEGASSTPDVCDILILLFYISAYACCSLIFAHMPVILTIFIPNNSAVRGVSCFFCMYSWDKLSWEKTWTFNVLS